MDAFGMGEVGTLGRAGASATAARDSRLGWAPKGFVPRLDAIQTTAYRWGN